tara:strand:+ start:1071 stop:1220 length:150 start_codon:yes stop_codon:yes gene_type:complete
MSKAGFGITGKERLNSFRDYNQPKKRTKPKAPKKKLPLSTTKGFQNDSR